MNYEPNTTHWQRGDLVLHDCDAKASYMLMRIVGYTQDGLVRTAYVDPDLQKNWGSPARSRLLNELKFLHDPKRFGVEVDAAEVAR